MKDAYYFSHDSNAKDDIKITLLIEELGLEGYGIFWVLVETLRDQPGYIYPLRLLPTLARKYNTQAAKVKAVVEGYSLFTVTEEGFFYSASLNRRMGERNLSRINGIKGSLIRYGYLSKADAKKMTASEILKLHDSIKNKPLPSPLSSPLNKPYYQERKGKERKEKENKEKERILVSENPTRPTENIEEIIVEENPIKSPLEKEKKVAPKKRKSGRPNWAKEWATIFDNQYKEIVKVSYQFSGKDFSNLSQIKKKLTATFEERQERKPKLEELKGAWEWLIAQAVKDKWLLENLSIAKINSQYNEIINKATGRTSKQQQANNRMAETVAEAARLLKESDL